MVDTPEPIEPCETCGKTPERCSFCAREARHFMSANVLIDDVPEGFGRMAATLYFCDNHKEELLSEEAQDGDASVELGMYCPTNDCRCDSWR
jgi:hypothetical protein